VRLALAGPFLQRLAKGGGALFELCRPRLSSSERLERNTQIVLRRGPWIGHALAGPFLQRLAKGGRSLLELRRPGLSLSERLQRKAQIVLRIGPVERLALAGGQLYQPLASLDCGKQGAVVAELVSLLIQSICFFL